MLLYDASRAAWTGSANASGSPRGSSGDPQCTTVFAFYPAIDKSVRDRLVHELPQIKPEFRDI